MSFVILLFYFASFEGGNSSSNSGDLLIEQEERHQQYKRKSRIAIQAYQQSTFSYMFNSGGNQVLLNWCGVDHAAFRSLLQIFEPTCFNSFLLSPLLMTKQDKSDPSQEHQRCSAHRWFKIGHSVHACMLVCTHSTEAQLKFCQILLKFCKIQPSMTSLYRLLIFQ